MEKGRKNETGREPKERRCEKERNKKGKKEVKKEVNKK
jgi:hypothetical protein